MAGTFTPHRATARDGLVKLTVKDSKVETEEVYFNKNMKNHHGGVVLVKDAVYGYSDNVGWICQDVKDGEIVWQERRALDKGAITYADGRIYCYGEDSGRIILADASPTAGKSTASLRSQRNRSSTAAAARSGPIRSSRRQALPPRPGADLLLRR